MNKGATSKYLRRHKEAVHESIPHPCQDCDYVGKTLQGLRFHIKNIHEQIDQIFYCDKCEYTAKKNETLKKHVLSKHEGV